MTHDDDFDKDCLHCMLAKAMFDYFARHPDETMEGDDIMHNIATLIGDIIEELPDSDQNNVLIELAVGVRQRVADLRKQAATSTHH